MKIKKLGELFKEYRIYPAKCFDSTSPLGVFLKMFPDNHYSKEIMEILDIQTYAPEQRGADLPWWGKNYFADVDGFRILIIAQDSIVKDAGSVVLLANLMPLLNDKIDYKKYTDNFHPRRSFFNSWRIFKQQFSDWNIDNSFLYITDAKKVYKKSSWNEKDFDKKKSHDLLISEIEICDPNLIIILGISGLSLLDKHKKYSSVVDTGEIISILDRNCIVSPFLTGQGRAQSNFKERLANTSESIKYAISNNKKIIAQKS